MTTVINLNVLNIYGQLAEKKPSYSHIQGSFNSRRDKSYAAQKTIDVTPSPPKISYKPAPDKTGGISFPSTEQPEVLFCYPGINESPDISAYSADHPLPKGTYVDSYV